MSNTPSTFFSNAEPRCCCRGRQPQWRPRVCRLWAALCCWPAWHGRRRASVWRVPGWGCLRQVPPHGCMPSAGHRSVTIHVVDCRVLCCLRLQLENDSVNLQGKASIRFTHLLPRRAEAACSSHNALGSHRPSSCTRTALQRQHLLRRGHVQRPALCLKRKPNLLHAPAALLVQR